MKDRPVAFSPADMKRRKMRAVVTALILAGLVVLFFVTTIYKIKQGLH